MSLGDLDISHDFLPVKVDDARERIPCQGFYDPTCSPDIHQGMMGMLQSTIEPEIPILLKLSPEQSLVYQTI